MLGGYKSLCKHVDPPVFLPALSHRVNGLQTDGLRLWVALWQTKPRQQAILPREVPSHVNFRLILRTMLVTDGSGLACRDQFYFGHSSDYGPRDESKTPAVSCLGLDELGLAKHPGHRFGSSDSGAGGAVLALLAALTRRAGGMVILDGRCLCGPWIEALGADGASRFARPLNQLVQHQFCNGGCIRT